MPVDKRVRVKGDVFIAPNATVIGNVEIDEGSSIWYNTVLRGDRSTIVIGKNTNIQDCSVVHCNPEYPTILGDFVTVGHSAVLHGCKIGDNSLIGIGAIILNGAEIGRNCIIGAGAVVTEETKIPDNSLVLGIPAKVRREVTKEEIEAIRRNALIYVELAKEHKKLQEHLQG
jgi:carbonic anhydrase/acetyltransferase-like protein (isoleucine patch superfamily)